MTYQPKNYRKFIANSVTAAMVTSAVELKMMKVFKMNDCDWVAHYSEEKAKAFYHDLTGVDMEDIEEDFVGDETDGWMYWKKEEVDLKEPKHDFEHEENSPFGDCYLVPFNWVLKTFPDRYPGMIATTEY